MDANERNARQLRAILFLTSLNHLTRYFNEIIRTTTDALRKRPPADRSFEDLVEERFVPVVAAEVVARGLAGDVARTLYHEIRRRRISIFELAVAARLSSTKFSRVFDEHAVPPLDLLQRIAHALGMRLDLRLVRTATAESP